MYLHAVLNGWDIPDCHRVQTMDSQKTSPWKHSLSLEKGKLYVTNPSTLQSEDRDVRLITNLRAVRIQGLRQKQEGGELIGFQTVTQRRKGVTHVV